MTHVDIVALFDLPKAEAWRTAHRIGDVITEPTIPFSWIPLDQRREMHAMISSGVLELDSFDGYHVLIKVTPPRLSPVQPATMPPTA